MLPESEPLTALLLSPMVVLAFQLFGMPIQYRMYPGSVDEVAADSQWPAGQLAADGDRSAHVRRSRWHGVAGREAAEAECRSQTSGESPLSCGPLARMRRTQ